MIHCKWAKPGILLLVVLLFVEACASPTVPPPGAALPAGTPPLPSATLTSSPAITPTVLPSSTPVALRIDMATVSSGASTSKVLTATVMSYQFMPLEDGFEVVDIPGSEYIVAEYKPVVPALEPVMNFSLSVVSSGHEPKTVSQ